MARRSEYWRVAWTGIVAASTAVSVVATVGLAAQSSPPRPVNASRDSTVSPSLRTLRATPHRSTSLHKDGYLEASKVTLRQLIQAAYQRHALDRRVIEGGPAWIDSELSNVTAKAAVEHVVDRDGQPRPTWLMLQTLLAEYFNLKLHTVIRAGANLRAGTRKRWHARPSAAQVRRGLRQSGDVDDPGAWPKANCGFQQYVGRYVPSVLTMADLATLFSEFVDRPVVNRTGLSGHYYAALEGAKVRPPGPYDAGYRPADAAREMFASMPKELGLRLEATTGPVEVLVIESVDNPNRPELPLVVERAEVGPGHAPQGPDQISVSVLNTGDKTIVAWGVRSQITFADGKTSGGGVSIDEVEYRGLERRAAGYPRRVVAIRSRLAVCRTGARRRMFARSLPGQSSSSSTTTRRSATRTRSSGISNRAQRISARGR